MIMRTLTVFPVCILAASAGVAAAQVAPVADPAPVVEPVPAPVPEPAPPPAPAPPAAPTPVAEREDDDAALARQLAAAEHQAAVADPSPEAAAPTQLDRSGITIEASLGVAAMGVLPEMDDVPSHSYAGRHLAFGVGTFMSPGAAIGLRVAASSISALDDDADSHTFTSVYAGPVLQLWPSEQVFVGLGCGASMLLVDHLDTNILNGVGFDARVGYNVHVTRHHAFHVALEVVPALYDEVKVVSTTVVLGWQML
jgi:hypothetical protein